MARRGRKPGSGKTGGRKRGTPNRTTIKMGATFAETTVAFQLPCGRLISPVPPDSGKNGAFSVRNAERPYSALDSPDAHRCWQAADGRTLTDRRRRRYNAGCCRACSHVFHVGFFLTCGPRLRVEAASWQLARSDGKNQLPYQHDSDW
jgi:hypothetical protein